MNPILITVIILTAIGLLVAAILFLVAKKFKVEEDARIDDVEAALPGANCGGCGYAGCRDFATRLVAMDDLGDALCPVGGSETMSKIADILGKTAAPAAPKVAVVKCNGSCEMRPTTTNYEGYASCKVKASLYSGDTGCRFGCLGCGDCTRACKFDAISMDPATGLPVVDESKCTGCGACSKVCPKNVIEMRPKGPRGLKVVVVCNNTEKGAVARKACKAACIGCAKCAKVCPHDAIIVENNLAYIDPVKCKLCTKCVEECPTGAIHKFNFPVRKAAPAAAAPVAPAAPAAVVKPAAAPAPEAGERPGVIPHGPAVAHSAYPETGPAARPKATAKPVEIKPEPKAVAEPAEVAGPIVEKKVEVKPVEPVVEPKVEVKLAEPVAEPKIEVKPAEPVSEPKVEVKPDEPATEPAAEQAKPAPKPRTRKPKADDDADADAGAQAPAPKKRAPRKPKAAAAVESAAEKAEATAILLGEELPRPAPKKRAPRKPKAEKPAVAPEDRDEVIDLDLFSGGVS